MIDRQSAMAACFRAPRRRPPTVSETAAHDRAQNIAAVNFPVDAARGTDRRRCGNAEVAGNDGIPIPFASIGPWTGEVAARAAAPGILRDKAARPPGPT